MRFANENGFIELNTFPGCNQIVVSNHSFIYPEKRGKGNGSINHKLNLQRAKFMGYDYLLCTVKADNIPELRILNNNGFKLLDTFVNSETGNIIELHGKHLK